MKVISYLTLLTFAGLNTGSGQDLPESVRLLIDQNSAVTKQITSAPYYSEVRFSVFREDEVTVDLHTAWVAPAEFHGRTEGISVRKSAQDSIKDQLMSTDAQHVLHSSVNSMHSDLSTKLTRSCYTSQQGGTVSGIDCVDPCSCGYKGVVELNDVSDRLHLGLENIGVFWRDPKTGTQVTLSELLEQAIQLKLLGREQVEERWCSIIEASYKNDMVKTFWLDEGWNGLVFQVDTTIRGKLATRQKASKIAEVAPGLFLPHELTVFDIDQRAEPGATNPTKINNKRELVRLSFNPEEWPNATTKDFGFRFMPNSIVTDLRRSTPLATVIGKDSADVVFSFSQMQEFLKWCDERSGVLPIDDSGPEVDGAGYFRLPITVGIVMVISVALCYWFLIRGTR